MPERILLYSAKLCPFNQRVEISLKEAGIPYERYEVDFMTKPEWYLKNINPVGKVPVMIYGGPKTHPEEPPSPEALNMPESLVLAEFVNDLSGNALLPKDPILRAKARFFIETVANKIIPAYFDVHLRGESPETVVSALQVLQDLLPAEGYAVGEWSIADAAVIPFIARAEVGLKNDLGAYDEGTGKKAWDTIATSPKFERFRKWFADVKSRKSFQETFDEAYILNNIRGRYPGLRAKRVKAGQEA